MPNQHSGAALPRTLVAVALALVAAVPVRADAPPSRADQLVTYRKALYQAVAWNVRPMGGMASGKVPFDAKEFAQRATNVAELTPMLAESFQPDSRQASSTKLKSDAWANKADFDSKLKALVDSSAALAATAKGTDAEATKKAFFALTDTCKSCHDKYKAD
ncbi:MAG: cytochrome c [Steroidobacteraceae bacterium]